LLSERELKRFKLFVAFLGSGRHLCLPFSVPVSAGRDACRYGTADTLLVKPL
jgi:hypothetical protein